MSSTFSATSVHQDGQLTISPVQLDPPSINYQESISPTHLLDNTSKQHQHDMMNKKNLKTEYKSKFTPFDQYVYNELTDSFVKHNNSLSSLNTSRSNQNLAANQQQNDDLAAISTQEVGVFEPSNGAEHHINANNEPWYKEVIRRNEKANEYRFKSEVGHSSPLFNYASNQHSEQLRSHISSPLNNEAELSCQQSSNSDARSQHSSDHQQLELTTSCELTSTKQSQYRFTPSDYKRDHLIAHMANNNNFNLPKDQQPDTKSSSSAAARRAQGTSSARSATRSAAQVRSRSQSSRRPTTSSASKQVTTTQPLVKSQQTTPTRTAPRATTTTAVKTARLSSAAATRTPLTYRTPTVAKKPASNGISESPTSTTRTTPSSSSNTRTANGTSSRLASSSIKRNLTQTTAAPNRTPRTTTTSKLTPAKPALNTAGIAPGKLPNAQLRGPPSSATRPATSSASSRTRQAATNATPSATSTPKSIKTPKAIEAAKVAAEIAAVTASAALAAKAMSDSRNDEPSANITTTPFAAPEENNKQEEALHQQLNINEEEPNLIFTTSEGGNMLADEIAQAERASSSNLMMMAESPEPQTKDEAKQDLVEEVVPLERQVEETTMQQPQVEEPTTQQPQVEEEIHFVEQEQPAENPESRELVNEATFQEEQAEESQEAPEQQQVADVDWEELHESPQVKKNVVPESTELEGDLIKDDSSVSSQDEEQQKQEGQVAAAELPNNEQLLALLGEGENRNSPDLADFVTLNLNSSSEVNQQQDEKAGSPDLADFVTLNLNAAENEIQTQEEDVNLVTMSDDLVNGLSGGLISAEDRFDSSERESSEKQLAAEETNSHQEQEQNQNPDDEPYSILPTMSNEDEEGQLRGDDFVVELETVDENRYKTIDLIVGDAKSELEDKRRIEEETETETATNVYEEELVECINNEDLAQLKSDIQDDLMNNFQSRAGEVESETSSLCEQVVDESRFNQSGFQYENFRKEGDDLIEAVRKESREANSSSPALISANTTMQEDTDDDDEKAAKPDEAQPDLILEALDDEPKSLVEQREKIAEVVDEREDLLVLSGEQQLAGGGDEASPAVETASLSSSEEEDSNSEVNNSELLMNVSDLMGAESKMKEEMRRKSELARQKSSPQPNLPQSEVLLSADHLSEQLAKLSSSNSDSKEDISERDDKPSSGATDVDEFVAKTIKLSMEAISESSLLGEPAELPTMTTAAATTTTTTVTEYEKPLAGSELEPAT